MRLLGKNSKFNSNPFMTKQLLKAIMRRSTFLTKADLLKIGIFIRSKGNLFFYLLRKIRKSYFGSINIKAISDNKQLWKMIKTAFKWYGAKFKQTSANRTR